MTETILALGTEDSAIGNLKASRIATRCEPLIPTLVWGVPPKAEAFFSLSLAPHADNGINTHWLIASSIAWPPNDAPLPSLHDVMSRFDRTELWVDPDANSQLAVMFLLKYLSDDPAFLGKLGFHQLTEALGSKWPDAALSSRRPLRPVTPADADLASRVWKAYSAPTPQDVPLLLEADLSRFPLLHDLLLALLDELPGSEDGLAATQRWILRMVAGGAETPKDLFSEPRWFTRPATYRSWQVGALIDELAHGRLPALRGIAESYFTLDMHDDPERPNRYMKSRISLSDFGRALLEGQADFAKENRIDRQWGGTRLTNETLWRWDGERRQLQAP